MGIPLYSIIEPFTRLPFNLWLGLVWLVAPVLIFNTKPQHNARRRIVSLVLAVGCTYVLINLALHTHRAIKRNAYETCQRQFPDGSIQRYEECGEINIGDGASNVFYLYLGWLPAGAYVGFWEWLWRRRHRAALRAMGNCYRGKWVGNVTIGMFLFCLASPLFMALVYTVRMIL